MAKKTIEVAFELGEKVLIVDHDITGTVNSIWIQRISPIPCYEIEWADLNKKVNTKYFSEAELKSVE